MYHDKHSAGFVLHHPPRHAKPSGHSAMMRAACAFLAAACLVLSVTVYPASAATSMSSLQNKLDKISASNQPQPFSLVRADGNGCRETIHSGMDF